MPDGVTSSVGVDRPTCGMPGCYEPVATWAGTVTVVCDDHEAGHYWRLLRMGLIDPFYKQSDETERITDG